MSNPIKILSLKYERERESKRDPSSSPAKSGRYGANSPSFIINTFY